MMYLNESILQLHQTYKKLSEKVQVELHNITKRIECFINIQNTDDNEYFKLCLAGYLHLADDNPIRITIADKIFAKELIFKDIKFYRVKIRDFHELKIRILSPLACFRSENKGKYSNYVLKQCCQK